MSAHTNIRLQSVVSTIDDLVANQIDPSYMTARVREEIKAIAVYQKEVEDANAALVTLLEEQTKLVAEAEAKKESIEIGRLGRRIEENAICISQTVDLIRHRQQAMQATRRDSLAYQAGLREIASLHDANSERAAKRLEFAAEIHGHEAEICKREARLIRLPLEIARAEAVLVALRSRLTAMCQLADSVAATLTARVKLQEKRAEIQAAAAIRRKAEEAAAIEAEAKARAQAEEAARRKAEAEAAAKAKIAMIDPGLIWLMEADGLNTADEQEIEAARGIYPLADIETARTLAITAQQSATA